mmetsp:Transcript_43415/g.51083  ORF Transcript_43415/g.51083 Transcript_43415/m.51083 type:complete len:124 (+) Transcript_43415:715-1086(+)
MNANKLRAYLKKNRLQKLMLIECISEFKSLCSAQNPLKKPTEPKPDEKEANKTASQKPETPNPSKQSVSLIIRYFSCGNVKRLEKVAKKLKQLAEAYLQEIDAHSDHGDGDGEEGQDGVGEEL